MRAAARAPAPRPAADQPDRARPLSGRSWATASRCHTRPGGGSRSPAACRWRRRSGSSSRPTSPPTATTGIGGWTEDQFYRAHAQRERRRGRAPLSGLPLSLLHQACRAATWTRSAPICTWRRRHNDAAATGCRFPLNIRGLMRGLELAVPQAGRLPAQSRPRPPNGTAAPIWSTGLGHCGACHTPKNLLGARRPSAPCRAALIDQWFAPDLDGQSHERPRRLDAADIVEFLKTGRNAHAGASASMGAVMPAIPPAQISDADLAAIAELSEEPAARPARPRRAHRSGADGGRGGDLPRQCSACHRAERRGRAAHLPAAGRQRQRCSRAIRPPSCTTS